MAQTPSISAVRTGRRILPAGLPLLLFFFLFSFPPLRAQRQGGDSRPGFTFFAVGDAGKPGALLGGTAIAMREEAERLRAEGDPLEAVIFLGDNFYPNGLNLEEKERSELIEEVMGPHRPLLLPLGRENVHAIAGNHDYYCATLGPAPYGTCFAGNEYERMLPEWTYYDNYPASVRYAVSPGSADSVELFFFDSAILLQSDPSGWSPRLDSLARLLEASARNRSVGWRLFFAHHSPYSVGAHGGYRKWDPERQEVTYVGNCIEQGDDPFKYAEELAGYHEDVCRPLYQAYKDSLFAIVRRSGTTIQAMFAGHDHTLQLLNYPERGESPSVFVVSGAGSKQDYVRSPLPPSIYTHPFNDPAHKGKSAGGFAGGRIEGDRLHLWFTNGDGGERLDMGGMKDFYIDRDGLLVGTR